MQVHNNIYNKSRKQAKKHANNIIFDMEYAKNGN